MKKLFAILIILSFVLSIFATDNHFDSQKFYSKTIVVCFDKQVVSNREGIINYTIENGILKTGISDFDKLAKTYKFIELDQQVKHLKDLDWNDNGIYPRNIYKVMLASDKNIEEALEALKKTPHILFAEYDPIMRQTFIPDDPMYPYQWHLPQIGCENVWDYITDANEVVVGIVDAGIYFTHPDLKNNIWYNEAELPGFDIDQILETGEITGGDGIDNDGNGYIDDIIGWNFKDGNNDAYQDYSANDHGTHVAGCTAAEGNNGIGVSGVAMHLKLISSKHAPTTYDYPYVSNPIPGMYYCIDNGADIINCSFGGPGGGSSYNTVVNYGVNHGTLTVTAAGNDNTEHGSSYHDYPSDCTNALCVAATQQGDLKASFSDYGDPIDIAAPGVDIRSTVIGGGGYASYQGTSMASPVTAGAAAIVKALHPNLTADQLRDRMMNTADYIYDINPDYEGLLGTGRVNVYTAAMYDLIPKLTVSGYNFVETQGNGDNVPNPGETFDFTMTLQNGFFPNGFWAAANNVIVNFSCEASGVTLSNTEINFGNIGQVGIGNNNDNPLVISTDQDISNLTIPLNIVIEANQSAEYPYHEEYTINLQLSLYQSGWPIEVGGASNSSAAIADINNDGTKEAIFATFSGKIYAANAAGETLTGFPVENLGSNLNTVAVSDINGNGNKEIIVTSQSGDLYAIDKDGNTIFHVTPGGSFKTTPMIAQINNEKKIVAITQSSPKIVVLNSDGTDYNGFPLELTSGIMADPAIGDLDNDGNLEVVFIDLTRNIHAISLNTGNELSGWPLTVSGTSLTGITLTDLDGDGHLDVTVPLMTQVLAFAYDGTSIFTKDVTGEQIKSKIVIGDITGNTNKELVFVTYSGKVFVIDNNGNDVDNFPFDMGNNCQSTPILSDIDNNGTMEILLGDMDGKFHSITLNNGETANFPIDVASAVKKSAALGDLDGDGDPEIIFPNQTAFVTLDINRSIGSSDWPTARMNNERCANSTMAGSGASNNDIVVPSTHLQSSYPNPFSLNNQKGGVKIRYYLKKAQNVSLTIYNIRGQKIATIDSGSKKEGYHVAEWNGKDKNGKNVATGIYLYKMNAGNFATAKKMIIIK